MLERALAALRFRNNSTLEIAPFKAHHGREANTVLSNLTKKPSVRILNWTNLIKSKSACLDEQREMPNPADTNWGIRSDSENGNRTRNHPITLPDHQALNQEHEPSARVPAETIMTAGPGSLLTDGR